MEKFQHYDELAGDFVVDHAEFVEQWSKENIPKGTGDIGAGILAAGIGISAGIFCQEIATKIKINPDTLKDIIVTQLNNQFTEN
jgi:hypothetical protein